VVNSATPPGLGPRLRRALRPIRRLVGRFAAPEAGGLPVPGSVRSGSAAGRVRQVQRTVNRNHLDEVPIDGSYGPATEAGVKALQRELGLPATGVADPLTVSLALTRADRLTRERATDLATPRRTLLRLPVPPQPRDPARPPRGHLILETASRGWAVKLLQQGGFAGYEAESTACFLALLDRLGPDGLFFDVGANVGPFSHLAAAVGGWRVVGFEPTPDLAAAFRRIAEANQLDARLEELALGAAPGAAKLYLSDDSDSSNSLNPQWRKSSRQLMVPVETLDNYVARTGAVPAVLKIDTESTDAEVLAGAQRLLAEHRPWLIVEVVEDEFGGPMEERVREFGYTYYPLLDDRMPMRPQPHLKGSGVSQQWNWLLAPEPLDDAFSEQVGRWRAALAPCTPEPSD
jgi:FkbM family methyltransferase